MKKEIQRAKDKIIIEAGKFAGKQQISLWKWYMDDNSQTYKPSKQGLTFNEGQAKEFKEFVNFLSENKDNLINHLFGVKKENISNG